MPDQLSESLVEVRTQMTGFIETVLQPLEQQRQSSEIAVASLQEQVRLASRNAGFFFRTQPKEFGGNPAGALELTMLREIQRLGQPGLC
jgi:alkylation response protein AidB-like acyl-CoA dehydrogenase